MRATSEKEKWSAWEQLTGRSWREDEPKESAQDTRLGAEGDQTGGRLIRESPKCSSAFIAPAGDTAYQFYLSIVALFPLQFLSLSLSLFLSLSLDSDACWIQRQDDAAIRQLNWLALAIAVGPAAVIRDDSGISNDCYQIIYLGLSDWLVHGVSYWRF